MKPFALPDLSEGTRRGLLMAANLFLLAFSVMMICAATGPRMRLPWYDPLGHRWLLDTAPPTFVSMDYYGRVGLSLLTGLASGLVGGTIAARRAVPAALTRAVSVWALALTLVGIALYGYAIGTRVIEPPPPGTITQPESD